MNLLKRRDIAQNSVFFGGELVRILKVSFDKKKSHQTGFSL